MKPLYIGLAILFILIIVGAVIMMRKPVVVVGQGERHHEHFTKMHVEETGACEGGCVDGSHDELPAF